ncbi:Serine/threonine-protein kinase brsk1 [Marasmius sp. AFHP31]|nr:Serine/threonine-protein kinase brsk1 [Marasmius sp. AFHP31]
MDSSDPEDYPQTIVVLLFGVKLVRVQVTECCLLQDLVARIQSSDELDFPSGLKTLMGNYQPRNYRYLTPHRNFPVHDIDHVPGPQELKDLVPLNPERAHTEFLCKFANPLDGSCLNLVVEEPLPIDQLSENGDARFRSREVIVFLNQHGVELFTIGYPTPSCSGRIGETSQGIWCKLVHERELNNFKALEPLGPDKHHIATLLLEPHLLPTNQYLVTMRDYGPSLFYYVVYSSWARERLCGRVIHDIAVQLCEAIDFLHSHCFFHLDIKPDNLAFDHITSRLTVLDLGWTIHSTFKKPGIYLATGTRDFAPPEVFAWFEWEDMDEDDPTPSPRSFDPRKADVWGIGNLIAILLQSDVEQVDHYEELVDFSQWLTRYVPKDRPTVGEALERLREISSPPPPQISSESKSTARLEGGNLRGAAMLLGVELVRIQVTECCLLQDLVARIQSSDELDLPSGLNTLMGKYQPRNYHLAAQLCDAITFLHSRDFFYLDIKSDNLAFDQATSRLTVLDLGWVMHGNSKNPVITGATGTRDYASPEVRAWFEWEATDDDDPTPLPLSFGPRKADVWGIGNLIAILLQSDVEQTDHYEELVDFSQWLTRYVSKDRLTVEEALERLEEIVAPI